MVKNEDREEPFEIIVLAKVTYEEDRIYEASSRKQ